MAGAGALAGVGFTMSLFLAGQAFPVEAQFAAAKIALFIASLIAGGLCTLILWPRRKMLGAPGRSEAHTSELHSLMRMSYPFLFLKKHMILQSSIHQPKRGFNSKT